MLVPDRPTVDLGNLRMGKPYSFDYIVTNKGSSTVSVKKVAVGCNSCTTASITPTTIHPGSTARIKATFTPGSMGAQVKSINVLYDNSSLRLEFKAHVNE